MTEQYAPIRTEPANQVWPVDLCRAAKKNVSDVGAVESFAFHDVSFHPNHFLRCAKFHRHAQQLVVACAVEPRIIYFAQSIAGAKNQIKDISLRRLGQPVRECQFGFVPCARFLIGGAYVVEVCGGISRTGVTMLNGEAVEIAGVGFAGICGFGGGFGRRMLNA